MPRSKVRKHHHQVQHGQGTVDRGGRNKSSVTAAIIFCAVLGLGIAYFAAGSSVLWLVVGGIVGIAAGYYFGKQLDKSFSKNKN
jgi:ABC-type dipeptide/oligopeptide/nickel transport system permease subunit